MQMSRSLSNKKSSREKVPSSRFDLSMTGMCGTMLVLLTNQFEVGRRAIGRIAHEPLRLDAKARVGARDHRLRGADLSLPNGTRGLDIHDDPELHVDEI